MYDLIRTIGLRSAITREFPGGFLALVTAEFFYKFHSFTLECLAFLATWCAFSWAIDSVRTRTWPVAGEAVIGTAGCAAREEKTGG